MDDTLLTLAGIAWDPQIRGLLSVAAGVAVLMGSIWLLLATNSGVRTASLLAFAGFFGWMAIMGSVWWIYGTGWVGESPSWETIDITRGSLENSGLDEARLLGDEDFPTARELVVAADDPVADAEFDTLPTAADNPDLSDEELADLIADTQLRNETITLSELAAVAPNVTDAAGLDDIDGWTLLSTSESGDPVAQATADIVEHPDLGFDDPADFKVLDAYTIGGKERLDDDPNRWERISLWVENSVRLTHPTRYTIVQLQRVQEQDLVPGEAPPRPVIDEDQPVISVILVRNLGNLRFKPAMLTLGSLAIFLALSYWLHVRDKEFMARREAFAKQT